MFLTMIKMLFESPFEIVCFTQLGCKGLQALFSCAATTRNGLLYSKRKLITCRAYTKISKHCDLNTIPRKPHTLLRLNYFTIQDTSVCIIYSEHVGIVDTANKTVYIGCFQLYKLNKFAGLVFWTCGFFAFQCWNSANTVKHICGSKRLAKFYSEIHFCKSMWSEHGGAEPFVK